MGRQTSESSDARWLPLVDLRFLVALALLGLNDHLFKAAWPSYLTGKLSDLVGPIVLAVLVACLGGRSRRATWVGIGATAALMVAVKTSPTGASGVEAVLEALTGSAQHIVVDPTDLMGLVGLAAVPRIVAEPRPLFSGRAVKITSLVVAAGLCMATSESVPPSLTNLVQLKDGTLVAIDEEDSYATSVGALYRQADGSWVDGAPPDPGTTVDIGVDAELCLSTDSQHCIRTQPNFVVQESTDGGESWGTVWSIDTSEVWVQYHKPEIDQWYSDDAVPELYETPDGDVVVAVGILDPVTRFADGTWGPSTADVRAIPSAPWLSLAIATVLSGLGLAFNVRARGEVGEMAIGLFTIVFALPAIIVAVSFFLSNTWDGLGLGFLSIGAVIAALPALFLAIIGVMVGTQRDPSNARAYATAAAIVVATCIVAWGLLIAWSAGWFGWSAARLGAAAISIIGVFLAGLFAQLASHRTRTSGHEVDGVANHS